jgi:hypothetical protein
MEGSFMKSMRSFSFVWVLLLAAAALMAAPTPAHAQSAVGKFTLSAETHWGRAVLPAGEYSYSIGAPGASTLVYVRAVSGSPAAMILATSITADDYTGNSRLILTRKGDSLFVTSFHLPTVGLVMDFSTPDKEAETRSLAMARQHGNSGAQ